MHTGDQVGSYRLIRLLATGGMGAVFEAYNDQLDRRVAVKFLHPTLAHDPEQNRRFFNEPRQRKPLSRNRENCSARE